MLVGTLATIRRYPVKSLRGEELASAEIGPAGVLGDRVARLIVESGHVRVGREYRGMENDRLHLLPSAGEAVALAARSGVALRIERGERFYYSGAISLIVDRWLEDLSAHVGYAVEPERFRPNFVVAGAPEFDTLEDALCGTELDVGDVRLRVVKPILRCVVTTYAPNGGASDPRILRYVAQERDAKMGVYCDVLRAGIARRGDSVRFVDR